VTCFACEKHHLDLRNTANEGSKFSRLKPGCVYEELSRIASIVLDHKPLRGRASLLVSVRRQSRLAENRVHRSPGLTYSQAARHKGVKANVSPSKDPTNQLSKGRMLLCDHPPVVVNSFALIKEL